MLTLVWNFLQPILAPFIVALLAIIVRYFEKKVMKTNVNEISDNVKSIKDTASSEVTKNKAENTIDNINKKFKLSLAFLFLSSMFVSAQNVNYTESTLPTFVTQNYYRTIYHNRTSAHDTITVVSNGQNIFLKLDSIQHNDTVVVRTDTTSSTAYKTNLQKFVIETASYDSSSLTPGYLFFQNLKKYNEPVLSGFDVAITDASVFYHGLITFINKGNIWYRNSYVFVNQTP